MKKVLFLVMLLMAAGLVAFSVQGIRAEAASEFSVAVSSTLADDRYQSENLTDGDASTAWYSQWADEKNPACNEWILLDFGSVKKVEAIHLTPNADRICFPADFTIGWGITGDVWPEIEGFSFRDYPLQGTAEETFAVNTVTRYIRISVTARNQNPDGNYLISLAEISATVRNATAVEIENAVKADAEIERIPVVNDPVIDSEASASSSNMPEKDWGVANVNDGLLSTQWCAEWGSGVNEEACEEWVLLTFSSPQYVTGVILESQLADHYGFPKSFVLEWTLDGENFFAVEGASYTDEPVSDTRHVKVFGSPVTATGIRLSITSSYADSGGNYLPQMAEFQAHGREATESEIAAATETFQRLLGETAAPAAEPENAMARYGTWGAVMLAFAVVFLGAAVVLAVYPLIVRKKEEKADEE